MAESEPRYRRDGPARAASRPLRFLCTNDDGIDAEGLQVLVHAAATLGEAYVVAPDRQRSGSSHSFSLRRPLRATARDRRWYAIDGTPTDCVLIAVKQLLHDARPDFVLSGVNHGANMGEDVLYSGTVAGAMEGTILGVPSVAISFTGSSPEPIAAFQPLLEALLADLVRRPDFPDETILNVNLPNIPAESVRGVKVTTLGRREYFNSLSSEQDAHGDEVFWIGGGESRWRGREDSDFRAVRAGYISVTPLHLDLTNFRLIEEVRSWPLLGS